MSVTPVTATNGVLRALTFSIHDFEFSNNVKEVIYCIDQQEYSDTFFSVLFLLYYNWQFGA